MIRFIDDLEAALLTQLKAAFPEVPFSTQEPAKRPMLWARLMLGSGSAAPVPTHEIVTFTVEVWHQDSSVEASQIANRVREEIQRWGWERQFYLTDDVSQVAVVRAACPRPRPYPPGDRWSRYTTTYQLTLSRQVITP